MSTPSVSSPERKYQRQKILFDSIKYSLRIGKYAFAQLEKCVKKLSHELLNENHKETVRIDLSTASFSQAWMFLTAIHRMREIAKSFPNIEREIHLHKFLNTTNAVNMLQDRVFQHSQSGFENLIAYGRPTWGSLTWITISDLKTQQGVIYTIVAGAVEEKALIIEDPSGKKIRRSPDLITLHAHGIAIPLEEILNEVTLFMSWFLHAVQQKTKLVITELDSYAALDFE